MLSKKSIVTLLSVMERKVSNVSEMLEYNQKQYDRLKASENTYKYNVSKGFAVKVKVDEISFKTHKEAIEKYEPLLKEYQDALDDLKLLQ